MESVNQNGILTITLCDRIDGLNAGDALQELVDLAGREPLASEILLDASCLNYISSAGLRSILMFTGKEKRPVSIVNVSEEIYTVFVKTGFTSAMTITAKWDSRPS